MIFTILLATFPALIVDAEPITLIVDDTGPADFSSIQEAIDSANSGETIFVMEGTYIENIVVSKSLTLTGENKFTTVIDGSGTGNAIYVTADYVTVTGFTVQDSGSNENPHWDSGIRYNSANNGEVIGNIIQDCDNGIRFMYSDYFTIEDNQIYGRGIPDESVEKSHYAIAGYYSDHGTISNNIATNAGSGIRWDVSTNVQFTGNLLSGNRHGFWTAGTGFLRYADIEGNTFEDSEIGFAMGAASNYVDIRVNGNNFINNGQDVYFESPMAPVQWDEGDSGNYWDRYDGEDLDNNGIGDTPYVINSLNADNYPLMKPITYEESTDGLLIAKLKAQNTNIQTLGEVQFDASDSYSSLENQQLNYLFDFGNGEDSGWVDNPELSYSYPDFGVYYPKVKVKNMEGTMSEWSNLVEIKNRLDLIKNFFPYMKFSSSENFFPCNFYFDDTNLGNNNKRYLEYGEVKPSFYVYIHEVEDNEYYTLQYWFYYAHNDYWLNKKDDSGPLDHIHDWDSTIFIVVKKADLSLALDEISPSKVGFAAHNDIDYMEWEDLDEDEKWRGTHVISYIASGTHAAYSSKSKLYFHLDKWIEGGVDACYQDFSWVLLMGNPQKTWVNPNYESSEISNQSVTLSGYGIGNEHPSLTFWPNRFYGGEGADPAPWQRRNDNQYKLWDKTPEWDVTIPKREGGSVLDISVGCPVDLHLYDSSGRHVGKNYETGNDDLEIPRAEYEVDTDFQRILVQQPVPDEYKIEIVGLDDGNFTLVLNQCFGDSSDITSFEGKIKQNETLTYSVLFESESHPDQRIFGVPWLTLPILTIILLCVIILCLVSFWMIRRKKRFSVNQ